MAQAFDICIRGGGIVGRTLALLLARERLRVALVLHGAAEPRPQPASPQAQALSEVRAYALNTASRRLLETLRCWPDPTDATAVQAMRVLGDDGGEVNFSAAQQGAEALAWIVDVAALEHRLSEAMRYQPLIELADAPRPASLTVVCEGKASSTRAELGVEFDTQDYGQSAIATRLQCERPHDRIARQWFAHGEILAFLPLQGEAGNSVAVVWSVPNDKVAERIALDDFLFARELERASHGALGALQVISVRSAWPLQLAQAARWVGSLGDSGQAPDARAWALAGDAAHTIHPLAGQGLNMGLADAAELARVLRERDGWRSAADPRLLRRYERARKAALLPLRTVTDGLQQIFVHDAPALQGLRNWGMKGFERSGPLKNWVARQAMGVKP